MRSPVLAACLLLGLVVAGCGSSGSKSVARPSAAEAHRSAIHSDIRAVKLRMTKNQVRRILGSPDELNELYGLPDLWIDWLWETDNGKAAITFSKTGRVTRIMDCPNGICTVLGDSTR